MVLILSMLRGVVGCSCMLSIGVSALSLSRFFVGVLEI